MRIISLNSEGSTVGRRSRCARTASIGSARIMSSPATSRPAASLRSPTARTSQAPFPPPARWRTRFQPLLEGAIKTGSAAGSILQFLPTKQYWIAATLLNYHLYGPGGVTGLAHTRDAHARIVKADEAGARKLRKLGRCKSKRNSNLIARFESRVVLRAVDSVRAAAKLQKAIDH